MANPRVMVPTQAPVSPVTREDLLDLRDILMGNNEWLSALMEGLTDLKLGPNIDTVIAVESAPFILSRNGRRHNMFWCSTAVTVLIDNLTGFAPFTLVSGWNVFDLTEGARIQIQSGPTVSILYRCTDFDISGAVA